MITRLVVLRWAIPLVLGFGLTACESSVSPTPDYRFEYVRYDNDTTPPFNGVIDSTYYYYQNLNLFNSYTVPDSTYREYRLDSLIHVLQVHGIQVKELWFQPLAGSCGDLAVPVGIELTIRLVRPDPRVYQFEFGRRGHNWWCWYNDIHHYTL